MSGSTDIEGLVGARDAAQPIGLVFVHGFNSSPSVWDKFVSLLGNDTKLNVPIKCLRFEYSTSMFRPWSPFSRVPTLNTVAQSFRGFLETEARDLDKLLLICHSQGGLVVQCFLAQMVGSGHGEQLTRIGRVVLFACPNGGSELGLSLRRRLLRNHPQERQLRPLNEQIAGIQNTIIHQIVYAKETAPQSCRIGFAAYAGERDNIVVPASAHSAFPDAGVLPGDHFSIVQPGSLEHRSYTALKHQIGLAIATPAQTPSLNPISTPALNTNPDPSPSSNSVPTSVPNAHPGLIPRPSSNYTAMSISLSIADDGHFDGGDQKAATDAVIALLMRPIEQRHVIVKPHCLSLGPEYKYTHPDAYFAVLNGCRIYERAIHLLLGGGIRFNWDWTVAQLIKAIIELRNFALPGIIEYAHERWYVWPAKGPQIVGEVRIPKEQAAYTRRVYYHDDYTRQTRRQGVPEDEPIWLEFISPNIVWEQVAPAAAFLAAEGKLDTPINMDDWVISDRNPSILQRNKPKAGQMPILGKKSKADRTH
ncbi:hypothetical protein N7467_011920 [Penicillium canescens]|nr:hypothetical protein N7467_011920 [Penicillium canescens]